MRQGNILQIFFWILTGSLLGLALIGFDIFFLSIPCFAIGICLLFLGCRRWGTEHLWVAWSGFGAIPTLFLLRDILSTLACPPQGMTLPSDVTAGTTVSCGEIPGLYYVLFICFTAITLLGLSWPFIRRYIRRPNHTSTS